MKRVFNYFLAGILVAGVSCTGGQKQQDDSGEEKEATVEEVGPNQLSDAQKDEGWKLLFDGEGHEGWRGVNQDSFPSGGWEVADGTLHCIGSGMGEAGSEAGGDILYDEKFGNFHLMFEYKISEGGNSGVLYLGQEVEGDPIWKTAPEFQVLDNERHIDANLGEDGNRQSASLYDLIPAKPQNAKPAGEWNTGEILVYKGTVVHKQNGETVLEYHLWTPEWEEIVKDSKFPELNEDWANVAKEGYIALQDHGDDVWYRGIKIKEL